MRTLVTGGTGFVGSRIIRRLRSRGDEVTALVRRDAPELAELGVHLLLGEVTTIATDQLEVDAVVHAAAVVGPDLATARAANRDGTARLVDAALMRGTDRFVHVSTTAVYDLALLGDAEVGESDALVQESSERNPTSSSPSAYAVTKAEAELEVGRGVRAGLSAAVLRPPAVLGAGPSSAWGTTVPRRVRDGEPLPLHPATTFGWVHVEDVVDAVLAALDTEVITTANVVGGHTAAAVYLDVLRSLFPDAPPLVTGERIWRGRYATDRLPSALGVHPSRAFEDAMDEIVASWRDGDPADRG